MKKHLKITLCLIPFLLVALYWLGIYLSLKNPMEEIVYSENGGMMRNMIVKSYTQTIGSEAPWKEDEGFQTFPYSDKIVGGKEHLAVTMFRGTADWFYMYKYKLNESTSVNLIFEYNASKKIFYQTDLYLTIDETSYEDNNSLNNLPPTAKTARGFETKVRKLPSSIFLVPGSKMEALVIP